MPSLSHGEINLQKTCNEDVKSTVPDSTAAFSRQRSLVHTISSWDKPKRQLNDEIRGINLYNCPLHQAQGQGQHIYPQPPSVANS